MKQKARDIIPGWPRGRSTTISWDNNQWRYWDFYSVWPHRHSPEFKEQMELEILYHQMQQAMVNEWFARYRLGDEVFNKCMIVKIYTGYRRVLRATLARSVEFCNGLYLPCDFFRRVS